MAVKRRSTQAGHPNIQENAASLIFIGPLLQQLLGRRIYDYTVSSLLQLPLDGGAEGSIVINDVDDSGQLPS